MDILDHSLSKIYNIINNHADNGEYSDIDDYIVQFKSPEHILEEMIMVLTVSLPYKDKLKKRDEYFKYVRDYVLETEGSIEPGLLTGLE
jgi:hypothetical protein